MNQPSAFIGNTGPSPYHPQPTPPSQSQEPQPQYRGPAQLYIDTQRAISLYQRQLVRVQGEVFATMAYGPFKNHQERMYALDRVFYRMPELLAAGNQAEIGRILACLEAGQMLEAFTHAVTVIWPRVLKEQGIKNPQAVKIPNSTPYTPPPPALRQSPTPRTYQSAIPSGPANMSPALSVAYPNTLTLSRPLIRQLDLEDMGKARIHLVVPSQIGGDWYLDTNPRPGMGTHFPKRGSARFRIQQVPKMHFGQRRPLFADAPGSLRFESNANVFVKLLHFELGEEVEGHPGYYHLNRVSRAVHH